MLVAESGYHWTIAAGMNLLTPPLMTWPYCEDFCCSPWEPCGNACQVWGLFSRGEDNRSFLASFHSGLEGTLQKSKALLPEETVEHSEIPEKGFFWMQGEHEGLGRGQKSLEPWDRPLKNVGNTGSPEITERKNFGGATKTNCKFCHNLGQPWVTDIQSNPVRMSLSWQDTVQEKVHLQTLSLLYFLLDFLHNNFIPLAITQIKPSFQV